MAIRTTKLVDDNFKIIVRAEGSVNENEQLLVDVINSNNATSEPKVAVANIEYEILGTGNVTIYFKNDTTKQLIISGRGNYGLKPNEPKIEDAIGDILLDTDSNVNKYNIIIECHKKSGYN